MNTCNTQVHGNHLIVMVQGEVDMSWSQNLRKEILAALQKSESVGVELSKVDYIDSSGIAALVEGFQYARGKGSRFSLIAVSASVQSVLELARLDRVFVLLENIDAMENA